MISLTSQCCIAGGGLAALWACGLSTGGLKPDTFWLRGPFLPEVCH